MNPLEKTGNILLGLSFISWSILGIHHAFSTNDLGLVRYSISFINLFVGFIIILRMPVKKNSDITSILASLPSIIACGLAFKFSQPTQIWPNIACYIFVGGSTLTVISFFYLGKSFAVLPSLRSIVIHGPYQFVRHPAYFGELLMIFACLLAAPKLTAIPFFIALIGISIRILTEERILKEDPAYHQYTEKVNWRLIPLVW